MELFSKKDAWLEPHNQQIIDLNNYITHKSDQILSGKGIEDFSLGHLFFGLHKTNTGWIFREWAPNATKITLLTERGDWREDEQLTRLDNGVWEIKLPASALKQGDKYKLHIYWKDGDGFRLPSYANYVVQEENNNFNAVAWKSNYSWQHKTPKFSKDQPLFIYEAHVGMSSDQPKVSSYREFANEIIPRIKKAGYNAIQLMALQEHPYYGSFGYHVSNFFAASSRFGSPDDLKYLIDTAHKNGILVIMDIVHSHAVKNEAEGLGKFDGTTTQYFYENDHPTWDSKLFDYGKPEVAHFLLSNARYFLEEYKLDGFRFDGVTSMIYHDHGLGSGIGSYDDYYGANINRDALMYLKNANDLIHKINPNAITIAEEVSGYPGLAASTEEGGVGFDYRLNMSAPNLWIKHIEKLKDEDWQMGELMHELSSHRPEERTITYAESHDQALVGDKTLIFRLIDKEMYFHMKKDDPNLVVDRGLALHKMIRLLTASVNNGGYLNFMGNEFGHPEWIDFPREGNDWSYKYARRQWDLLDSSKLKYQGLANFDSEMVELLKNVNGGVEYVFENNGDKVLSFIRDNKLFVFNFNPEKSFEGYRLPVARAGSYRVLLSSDELANGGFGSIVKSDIKHEAYEVDGRWYVDLYLPARTSVVYGD